MKDENGNVVWKLEYNNADNNCKSNKLEIYDELHANQYICDGNNKFGLGIEGELVHIVNGEVKLFEDPGKSYGDENIMVMQDSGNLVVYNGYLDEPVMWKSYIASDGGKLVEIHSDGNVVMKDKYGYEVWKLQDNYINKLSSEIVKDENIGEIM